jgi:hypothetical protein
MKTTPFGDGNIPLRGSRNPVLGVFRHHCGQIASVHQPKGKRSKTRYLICDDCGTDQCGGKPYQDKISLNTHHTIEALQAAEGEAHTVTDTVTTDTDIKPLVKPLQATASAVHTVTDKPAPKLSGLAATLTASLGQKKGADKPLDTAPHAVQTVNQPTDNINTVLTDDLTEKPVTPEPLIKPLKAKPSAVQAPVTIPLNIEPKLNEESKEALNDTPPNPPKPMRIGIAALIGGAIGALLGAVA